MIVSNGLKRRWVMVAGLAMVFAMGIGVGFGIGRWLPKPNVNEGIVQAEVLVPSPTAAPTTITMLAVGDVMLGRSVREQMMKYNDWTWPWIKVGDKLQTADITVGNLESQIVTGCTQHENRFMFCANPEAVAGLVLAGFDVLSLVNNHDLNYGSRGREDSFGYLAEANISGVLPDMVVTQVVKGVRFGFLAYDDVTAPIDPELLELQIASAAAAHDVVVGIVHWGSEYVALASDRQVNLAHAMVDAGMNVIVGAHPHWVQNVESYNDALILYSLGNFVFDQMWSEETREGMAAEITYTLQDNQLHSITHTLLPVKIDDFGQPRWIQ